MNNSRNGEITDKMVNGNFNSGDVIIEANDLWKSYGSGKNEVKVLCGIDLTVKSGEFITVSGASGAGKSTLLHLLGMLDTPTKGDIYFKGVDVKTLSNNKKSELRNNSFGFIFQFFHLLPEFTALENVILPALINKNGLPYKDKMEKAKYLLDHVGLSHRLKHKPSELSGGEQQRVAVARSLMNDPCLILADEPTGNLDKASSIEIQDLLIKLRDKTDKAVIVVTHNPELAGIGSSKLNMVDGKLYK